MEAIYAWKAYGTWAMWQDSGKNFEHAVYVELPPNMHTHDKMAELDSRSLFFRVGGRTLMYQSSWQLPQNSNRSIMNKLSMIASTFLCYLRLEKSSHKVEM